MAGGGFEEKTNLVVLLRLFVFFWHLFPNCFSVCFSQFLYVWVLLCFVLRNTDRMKLGV